MKYTRIVSIYPFQSQWMSRAKIFFHTNRIAGIAHICLFAHLPVSIVRYEFFIFLSESKIKQIFLYIFWKREMLATHTHGGTNGKHIYALFRVCEGFKWLCNFITNCLGLFFCWPNASFESISRILIAVVIDMNVFCWRCCCCLRNLFPISAGFASSCEIVRCLWMA